MRSDSITPGPLKDLGAWLAAYLDEDQWPTAERLLLEADAERHRLWAAIRGLDVTGGGVPCLPSRIMAVVRARKWGDAWPTRYAYLGLEAAELVEAIRGKRGDPTAEAADTLLCLMALCESAGLDWAAIEARSDQIVTHLETAPRYTGEHVEAI